MSLGRGFVALDLGTARTRTSRGSAIADRSSDVFGAAPEDSAVPIRPIRHGMVADPAACLRLVRQALHDARPPDEPLEQVLVGVPLAATQSDRRAVHTAVVEAITGRPVTRGSVTRVPAAAGSGTGRASGASRGELPGGLSGDGLADGAHGDRPPGDAEGGGLASGARVDGLPGGAAGGGLASGARGGGCGVWLVDEPVAAAVGAGLDVVGAEPLLLLDVGAGIVEAVAVREGAVFDAAALQLGATTSAGLLPYALDGVVEMTAALVRRLPDDVRPSVPALTVTGGGARQRRLLHRLQTALRMPVNAVPEPEYATIRGLSRMGRHPELASRISRQGR
ncbi:hypothetical protein AB0K12_30840 [Nonomuraea sp. NPDC049419]|uniref:hypothetical protein n=1 Tax=Nonomuraea sp. NPDC049419 TaxID=3155772 RepID=UPI0034156DC3